MLYCKIYGRMVCAFFKCMAAVRWTTHHHDFTAVATTLLDPLLTLVSDSTIVRSEISVICVISLALNYKPSLLPYMI